MSGGAPPSTAEAARHLAPYLRPVRGRLLAAAALALGGVVLELARPWPIKAVVDYALAGEPPPAPVSAVLESLPGAGSREAVVAWSVVALVLLVAVAGALALAVLSLTLEVSRRVTHDLSLDLFGRLQRLSLAFHARHPSGDLQQRMTSDVFALFVAVAQVALPATIALLTLAGMAVVMALIDVPLTLVTLSVVPVLAAALALFARPLGDTSVRQSEHQGRMLALVQGSLFGIRSIQSFAREAFIQSRVERQADALGRAYVRSGRVSGAFKEVSAVVSGLGAAAVLGVGAMRVMDGALSLGDLLVFLGYVAAIYGPVVGLSVAVAQAVEAGGRARRVVEVLRSGEEVPEAPAARELARPRGRLAVEDVVFGYAPGRPLLRGIGFAAEPGTVTAIVGATGAGKTSLISLLVRLYDPWEGRVTLDGHDLRDLTLRSLRESVSVVPQEPALFAMTIADNIAFGRPDATRDEVEAAARAAEAHAFISALPDGYETVAAEWGRSLSGGEAQRIAIARALLKDAPVLVLDEPTSALDSYTEARIFESLRRSARDRTLIVISHRLSTISRADRIVVIEDGRVAEAGTHADLMAAGGLYARLSTLRDSALALPAAEAEWPT